MNNSSETVMGSFRRVAPHEILLLTNFYAGFCESDFGGRSKLNMIAENLKRKIK